MVVCRDELVRWKEVYMLVYRSHEQLNPVSIQVPQR